MAFTRLSARDTNNDEICKNNPNPSAYFFRCHQAILKLVLVLLVFGIIMLVCRFGFCIYLLVLERRKRKRAAVTNESNSKENNHQPSLPYPQPPSEMYETTKELGPNNSTSTLIDPYLITNGIDKSLISQDDSFKQMALPEPVLNLKGRESATNHSASDLPEPMVDQPSELQVDHTIQLHNHDNDDDKKEESPTSNSLNLRAASPPPAYDRTSHSEGNNI